MNTRTYYIDITDSNGKDTPWLFWWQNTKGCMQHKILIIRSVYSTGIPLLVLGFFLFGFSTEEVEGLHLYFLFLRPAQEICSWRTSASWAVKTSRLDNSLPLCSTTTFSSIDIFDLVSNLQVFSIQLPSISLCSIQFDNAINCFLPHSSIIMRRFIFHTQNVCESWSCRAWGQGRVQAVHHCTCTIQTRLGRVNKEFRALLWNIKLQR